MRGTYTIGKRILAMLLCIAMVAAYLPGMALTANAASSIITVADPETLTRPGTIYGDSTVNAGKITVGKSVSDTDITVNGQNIAVDGEDNFLVTISQSSQVMGLTSQVNIPLDVVIVFDTSGSMGNDSNNNGKNRTQELVEAANKMIATLMGMNDLNRVGVVAFSAHNAGGGTAGYNAANVLSELAHYDGEAATEHLTWAAGAGPSWAPNVQLVRGRSTTGNQRNSRYGTGGATNIQAGVTLGAQLLMEADTTVEINNQQITRMPVMILMSDGAPTVSAYENQWWNASQTNNQGPTNAPFMGNGFLTVLTASHYKNEITEHYYGTKPGENACSFYTVGVELSNAATQDTQQEVDLSYMTLNPKEEFVAGSDNYYYDRSTAEDSFLDAWTSYQNNRAFKVRVWSDQSRHDGYYYFYTQSQTLQNANDYKNGADTWTTVGRTTVQPNILNSVTTLHYNDQFYNVTDVSQLTDALNELLTEIARKAITVPTKVTTGDHDFDGYVTFTDPIGEYMEVKDMKGVLAGGYFYQGASFAQKIANYGTAQADAEFDKLLVEVLQSRMNLTESVVDFDAFAKLVQDSKNQAYYNGPNDYDNSIVWWGNAYDSGEEDEQVQVLGFADNDTVEYIEQQKAAGKIPAGADYVCRSYFFYGEAGGANTDPDHTYLYFMVRVQRELTAPYRETVVISAPASLLSMEKVLINESFDENGDPVYTATVEHQEPARVVYEVGLWDTITAENVADIVSAEYAAQKVNGVGSVNYDATTDTYSFFTNDWDRSQSLDSHHRGMAKATFDAAADNAFYTYQHDTLLVDANGDPVTADPAGKIAYYVREYYAWPDDSHKDGVYSAVKQSVLVEVDVPADAQLIEKDGKWYIPAGTYTAATLVVNGDDTVKDDPGTVAAGDGNKTGTSSVVAHPHRTGSADNSHYTVFLGNNGKLSLVADPYEPVKTVSVNLPGNATRIVDDEGKAVKVGDVLTYTVEVKNTLTTAADITVTDYVPLGTAFVAGSAGTGTGETGHTKDASIVPDGNNVLTWVLKDVPAGEIRYVSFQAAVSAAALSLNAVSGTIDNTAVMALENGQTVSTNTTHNPPYGKTVTDVNNQDIDGEHGFKVGDVLVYHIRFHNNAMDSTGKFVSADVTVTDKIPAGTTFLSADNGGSYDSTTGLVTWNFADMAADTAAVVSFRVRINASAKAQEAAGEQADGIEPATGEIYLPNTATIAVDSDPKITLVTNTTENWADVGDLVISKLVADGGDRTKVFTIRLTESTGLLSGKYPVSGGNASFVEFVNGQGAVSVKHGQSLTVQGLPAGVIITVEEDVSALPGWTPAYNTQTVTIAKGAATAISSVSVTNTYALEPLTVTLKGEKIMEGVALNQEATFGFVAVPDSGNPVVGDPLTGEVTVQAPGKYSFTMSPKVFTQPGVYQYTISEINGAIPGVTYENTEYVLVITITDNGDGTMGASATLNGGVFDLNTGVVSFTNAYAPGETQLELTAKKSMSGRQLTAGEFNFQITDGTNTYQGIHDADGNIVFETISYTAAGTYQYTMSEVVPDNKAQGVAYDTTTYAIQVTVTDQNGQLVAAVSVNGNPVSVTDSVANTGITFRNSFEPDDVPLTLVADKNLKIYDVATGTYVDSDPEAGEFRFQILEKATGNPVASASNAADGSVTFSTIYFSDEMLDGAASKTFTYVISEIVPELVKDPNMRYDTQKHEIAVTLSQATDGKLTVAVGSDTDGNVDTGITFVNYSNPDTVSVTPSGKKTTIGENLPAGLSFSFQVIPVDGNVDAAIGSSNATVGGGNSETTGITFTSMVYTHESLGSEASKTYSYWIMESNAKAGTLTGSNGVTYDSTRYLYQVTVSRDAYNRLVADEKYFALAAGGTATDAASYTVQVNEANVTFNNRYEADTHINLTAEKKLTGRTPGLAANEFDFVLNRLDASGKLVSGSEITGTNTAAGLIHFATLNYSSAMLDEAYKHADGAFYFSYLMREIKPAGVAIPGVTYDTAQYVVTVKVTQDTSGLTAQLAGVSKAVYTQSSDSYAPGTAVSGFTAAGDTNVTFTNTYTAVEGDVVKYQIRKDLEGRSPRAGEFEFGLYLNGKQEDIATNDENGIVTFSRVIPASAASHAGTYKMVIKESAGSVAGVTYSSEEYTVYVKVTDNGAGKIEATVHLTEDGPALPEDANGMVDLTNDIVFHNSYEPHDTSYTPVAVKRLTGRAMMDGEFSFRAQLISRNAAAVANGAVYNGINNAQGDVVFAAIPYTEEGTYVYRISEVAGSHSGVEYDTAVYYLKVVVADNSNGNLVATGTYYTDEALQNTVSSVVFSNTYTPAGVAVQLEATKKLTGRSLADKEFSFVVRKDNVSGKIVATGNNQANGEILFSTFDITAADLDGSASKTFTYVIVESDNKTPGVAVDSSVFTATVTVTDDGSGKLAANVSYSKNGTGVQEPVFTNTYTPASTHLPLVAFKSLTGKNLLDGEFTFELRNANGLVESVKNDANGVIDFQDLEFTAEDMVDGNGNRVASKKFVYTLSELPGTLSGNVMEYDSTVYRITVTVTDDGKGHLTATAAYENDKNEAVQLLQFVNKYTPTAITVDLEGSKVITDSNGTPLNDAKLYPLSGFVFEVYDVQGNFITEAISDVDGKFTVSDLEISAAGEYRYLISEKTTTRPGYTTDPTVWCVHVMVGYDADKGELYENVDARLIHVAPESHEEGVASHASQSLRFVNVYDPEDVSLTLKVKKDLTGRELKDHEFTFYMVDDATGLLVAETRNHANGDVNLHLSYSEAKSYTYTIYEHEPDEKLDGVEYSKQKYKVAVTVSDDGSGVLTAKVGDVTVVGTEPVDLTGSVVFQNTYTPAPVDVTVEALKRLTGKELGTDDFSFELVNQQNAAEKYTAYNTADGKVAFEKITFTAAGDYVYSLSEVKGSAAGVTYDAHVYTVTVHVTDDGNGKLHAQIHYTNSDGGTEAIPVFNNTYKPEPAVYTPEVKKIFEGGAMQTFRFVLSGEGFETQIKHNDANGDVKFDALTFANAGSYLFTIREEADASVEDIKWDENVYTLQIEVVDKGIGQLEIEDLTVTSDKGRDDLVFHNVHEDLITDKDVFKAGDLSVAIDGMSVEKGDVLTYIVSYKNYTGKLADIIIRDVIPQYTVYVEGSADKGGTFDGSALEWKFTDVAPNEPVTVSFNVEVTGVEGVLVNQATVVEGENTYTTEVVSNPITEDKLVKDVFYPGETTVSIDGKLVQVGEILEYVISYTNASDRPVDLVITDEIPAHTELHDAKDGTYDGSAVTWEVKAVQPGQTASVSFQVKVLDPGAVIENQATVNDGVNKQTNRVTNTTPVKTVDKQVASVGETLTYTVSYTNDTGAAAAVTITDKLDSALTYVAGSASHAGVFADGVITWNIPQVDHGETVTVTFRGTVKADTRQDSVRNVANILENESDAVQTNEVITKLVKPALTIEKKQSVGNGKPTTEKLTVKAGNVVTYYLTVTNTGDGKAVDATVRDEIPAGLVYVDGSASDGGKMENGVVSWNMDVLEAGQSVTLRFKVKVPTVEKSTGWVNMGSVVYKNDPNGPDPILSNEVQIELKVSATPQTGDGFNAGFFMVTMALSATALAVLVICKKKEEFAQ